MKNVKVCVKKKVIDKEFLRNYFVITVLLAVWVVLTLEMYSDEPLLFMFCGALLGSILWISHIVNEEDLLFKEKKVIVEGRLVR